MSELSRGDTTVAVDELRRAVDWVHELRTRTGACNGLAEVRDVASDMLRRRGADAVPGTVRASRVVLGGVEVVELTTPRHTKAAANGVYLHFHGGGFMIGRAGDDILFLSRIAARAAVRSLSVEYRLAPESSCPAAVEDGVAVYRELLACGTDPARIVIGGESAGGSLALLTVLALAESGLPPPGALALQSPLTDFTQSGRSLQANAGADPFTSMESMAVGLSAWLAGTDAGAASPVGRDLTLLPPVLIQVGADEVLLDDARSLAERVIAAGGQAVLEIWQDVLHTWHGFAHLTQAERATEAVAEFVRGALDRAEHRRPRSTEGLGGVSQRDSAGQPRNLTSRPTTDGETDDPDARRLGPELGRRCPPDRRER